MSYKFLFSILVSTFVFLQTGSAYAAPTPPGFPSCVNPNGTLKVQFNEGLHGIPGTTADYRGSDKVYQVSSEQLIQCFCPESGDTGIQTNWWKLGTISDQDLQDLKNQGWSYIPNGSLWGLDPVSYVAKNDQYTCRGSVNGIGGGSENKGVLGAGTLAATGTTLASKLATIFGAVLLLGGAFTFVFISFKKRNRLSRE